MLSIDDILASKLRKDDESSMNSTAINEGGQNYNNRLYKKNSSQDE